MPPSKYGDFYSVLRGYRRQKNKARRPCNYRTAHGQSYSFLFLKTLAVIQGNPASAALEFSPPCGRTRAGFHLSNRKHTFPRIFAGLGIIRAGAFADVQIRCCHLYQKGTGGISRAGLLSGIYYLAALILHGISSICVRPPVCIIQIVQSPFMAL